MRRRSTNQDQIRFFKSLRRKNHDIHSGTGCSEATAKKCRKHHQSIITDCRRGHQHSTGQHRSRQLAAASLLPAATLCRAARVQADAAAGGGGGDGGGGDGVVLGKRRVYRVLSVVIPGKTRVCPVLSVSDSSAGSKAQQQATHQQQTASCSISAACCHTPQELLTPEQTPPPLLAVAVLMMGLVLAVGLDWVSFGLNKVFWVVVQGKHVHAPSLAHHHGHSSSARVINTAPPILQAHTS